MRLSRSKNNLPNRALILFGAFLIFGGLIIARLAHLQVVDLEKYSKIALGAQQFTQQLEPLRGSIFTQDQKRNLVSLAENKQWDYAILVPDLVVKEERADLAAKISKILDLDYETVLTRVSKDNDPYEPLKDKITPEEKLALKELNQPAIIFLPSWDRYYPAGDLSAQVIGFWGFEGDKRVGQYGIEGAYESSLRGVPGMAKGEADATRSRNIIPFGALEQTLPVNGADIVLTVDPVIAEQGAEIVNELKEKYQAKSASILVIDPNTGAIMASETSPSFDLNNYSKVDSSAVYTNPLFQQAYEPGSIFKPVTMAMGLDLGLIKPETYYEDKGLLKFGTYTIQNFDQKAHGTTSMTQVLEKSLNTGAVFVQQKVGNAYFKAYAEAFGFGELTGLDLPESAGDIKNLASGRDINFATASFGQGISVTPIQIAAAFAAIANGGNLVKPYIVDRLIKADGEVESHKPEVRRKVVASETASTLTKMLVSVVDKGFDRKATVSGYKLAGKTGTAQIPNPRGGYYDDKFVHSFIGFGPAEDPKFLVFIKLEMPQGVNFASNSVAPSFGQMAKFLLNYLQIPPASEDTP